MKRQTEGHNCCINSFTLRRGLINHYNSIIIASCTFTHLRVRWRTPCMHGVHACYRPIHYTIALYFHHSDHAHWLIDRYRPYITIQYRAAAARSHIAPAVYTKTAVIELCPLNDPTQVRWTWFLLKSRITSFLDILSTNHNQFTTLLPAVFWASAAHLHDCSK